MRGKAELEILGDVKDVLEGRAKLAKGNHVCLEDISFGLGAGAFSDRDFFGETLIFFHQAMGTIVTQKGELKTENKQDSIDSPFFLCMKIVTLPSSLRIIEDQSFKEILLETKNSSSLGCFYVGWAHFDPFEGAYLKKSPIEMENINDNKERYWQNTGPLPNRQAFFFGMLVTEKGKEKIPNLDKAFYQNPNEKEPAPFLSHTHSALTENVVLPTTWDQLKKGFKQANILGVRHFLTQSFVKKGSFAFFELSNSL